MNFIHSLLNGHKATLRTLIGRIAGLFILISLCAISAGAQTAPAEDPEPLYASSSRLASGKWARIKVTQTGMQVITASQLRALGLDPKKTRVYGWGGRMVPESFPQGLPDDLPVLPSVMSGNNIIFYGTDNVTWTSNGSYNSHTAHPYSTESYYFLSDSFSDDANEPEVIKNGEVNTTTPLTTFRARLLHEQDLFAPSNSGRTIFGEDFRSQPARTFNFNLIDNAGQTAWANVKLGAAVSNGRASFIFTANGTRLNSEPADQLASITASDVFMTTSTTRKTIQNPGNKLSLLINYSGSGSQTFARLDWIEINYDRQLKLHEGQLHFYGQMKSNETLKIDGCNAETVIWDVTNPWAPRKMEFDLQGSSAMLALTSGGYREFIAFNPSKAGYSVAPAGKVSNQDIHSLPTPDMVIISPSAYISASEKLADMHRKNDGMVVHVLTPESIYNEFSSGTPDVGAFRKMMKMWQVRGLENPDEAQLKYCLIMSRPTYDNKMVTVSVKNAGYPRVPIWQSPTGNSGGTSYSCDDFIGMLDHNMRDLAGSTIHVAVGRLPVKSVNEAEQMVDKIINYVNNPDLGSWRNHILLIADDNDNNQHIDDSIKVHEAMLKNGNGSSFVYDLLYFDAYPLVSGASGNTYPDVTNQLIRKWDEGVGLINYIGHAHPMGWSHEKVLTWEQINNFTNERLPFLYAATCEFARWDADEVSGAEIMLLNPTSGIIGGIIPSRTVYMVPNGTLNAFTMGNMFKLNEDGSHKRVGDIMIEGKNLFLNDSNKLRYCLLSDPALRIPMPDLNVETLSIADSPVDEEAPVIGARSTVKVEGVIADDAGNVIDDFNGVIEVTLFDAEVTVTTNGNGDKGKIRDYNDRSVRLTTESTQVVDGHWKLTLRLPAEIENNYSPALLSYYAYTPAGREANGMCNNLYVFGYDETAEDDTEGPKIEMFTLNHPDFAYGDVTHSSPIVIAKVSDDSGINISDASIGHNITLSLDETTIFNDVSSKFIPDPTRDGAGSLTYPLEGLEPGEHTLTLKVWDNAGNSSSSTLAFQVALRKSAGLASLHVSPKGDASMLTVSMDRPVASTSTLFEIYDLAGNKVWHREVTGTSKTSNTVSVAWDRCDDAGRRVNRGIYICRATVTTSDGAETHISNKLAVAAQ